MGVKYLYISRNIFSNNNFKNFFLNNPPIFFYLDIIYKVNCVSVFLINISYLFIIKQIFNRITILIDFKYFLDYLQLYLIGIENIRSVFLNNISIKNTFILNNYINIELFSTI